MCFSVRIVKTIKDMRALCREVRFEGKSIGFVPTMGALHEGHLSLVKRSTEENDVTVVSIFVNPVQFGPHEDFNEYPGDLDGDLDRLSPYKVDAVFYPDSNEMYPEDFSATIDMGSMGEVLCGASRPGHFNGVATVVAKLFNIVMPRRAYFGQKDFQQTVLVRKLARELNFDTEIVVCPIIRDSDGLAMSSRNVYLSDEERRAAPVLHRSLKLGEELMLSEDMKGVSFVKNAVAELIKSEPLAKIDYISIVDTHDLKEVESLKRPLAICLAVTIGTTRLIDNLIVDRE
jgi:pantoate--beta-alanine ligase